MNRRSLFLALTLVLALAILPVEAQSQKINGTIAPGSDGTGVATRFEDEWNSGTDFDCETGSPILNLKQQYEQPSAVTESARDLLNRLKDDE